MLGWTAGQESEHCAFSYRGDQSAVGRAARRKGSLQLLEFLGTRKPARSTLLTAAARTKTTEDRQTPTSATILPCIRRSDSPPAPVREMGSCWTSKIRPIRSGSTRSTIRIMRIGTRPRFQMMGKKSCSPMNGAAEWARDAARTIRTNGAPTRFSAWRTTS